MLTINCKLCDSGSSTCPPSSAAALALLASAAPTHAPASQSSQGLPSAFGVTTMRAVRKSTT
jgi:hypothetical protein